MVKSLLVQQASRYASRRVAASRSRINGSRISSVENQESRSHVSSEYFSAFSNVSHFLTTDSVSPVARHFSASLQPVEQDSQDKRIRFDELDLHPKSLKALRRQGLHKQTEIQEKSFEAILKGHDVVGRARTGTGKTLSFLLPSLERILQQKNPKPGIQMLILSPTRELAAQIGKEALRLVEQHDSSITSQVIFGGSSKNEDIHRFSTQSPTILVATPGRLKDHLAKTKLRRGIPFIDTVQNLQILVLDETDRLLDMGFRQDIQDILSCLPRKRQTLLFSATMPPNVRSIIASATNDGQYELVDCMKDEDPATHTNAHTEQSHIVLPSDKFWTGSMELLLDLMENRKSKIMVFFPMTSLVQLYSQLFQMRFGRRVLELHGRMHQRERTTISGRFRNASKGIIFTSDVSARGVDYPNVTHVVQIGAAESRETYIHRLGRTGRAGKKGQGLLVLPEIEEHFLQDLEGLDIPQDTGLQNQLSAAIPSKLLLDALGPVAQDVRAGKDQKLERSIGDAYQAMIAYYYQRLEDRQDTDDFVATVNTLAQNLGLSELPPIDFYRAKKIGIDTIPELNIQHNWKDRDWSSGWGEKPTKDKKPFGKPYGDFEGKFEQPQGRRKILEESPDSVRGRDRNPASQHGSRSSSSQHGSRSSSSQHGSRSRSSQHGSRSRSSQHGSRSRSSQHGSRSRSSGRFRSDGEMDEQFLKLGWKSGLTGTTPRGGSNTRRKNKAFQRWDSKGSSSSG